MITVSEANAARLIRKNQIFDIVEELVGFATSTDNLANAIHAIITQHNERNHLLCCVLANTPAVYNNAVNIAQEYVIIRKS